MVASRTYTKNEQNDLKQKLEETLDTINKVEEELDDAEKSLADSRVVERVINLSSERREVWRWEAPGTCVASIEEHSCAEVIVNDFSWTEDRWLSAGQCKSGGTTAAEKELGLSWSTWKIAMRNHHTDSRERVIYWGEMLMHYEQIAHDIQVALGLIKP